jgi:hypothetical protein
MLNDNILAPFSQISTMSSLAAHSAAATKGACHNVTIEWLSFMKANSSSNVANALSRMKKLSDNSGASNAVLQAAFVKRWGNEGSDNADSMMISLRGLSSGGMAILPNIYNFHDLYNLIKNPTYPGMIYSFWFSGSVVGAGGGAHTIGFYRDFVSKGGKYKPADDFVSVFDPNFGEFKVSCADVDTFWLWFYYLANEYGGNDVFTTHICKYVR